MQFFQGEHHACQRRIEGSRKAGSCTACDEVALFHAGAAEKSRETLPCYSTDLDGGTFTAQRQACADAESSGKNFHPENTEPLHFVKAQDDPFHLGNAGARSHGGIAAHEEEAEADDRQGRRPAENRNGIHPGLGGKKEGIVDVNAKRFRFSEEKTEEGNTETSQNPYENPFHKEAETELVPVVQGYVGFKKLAFKGGAFFFSFHREPPFEVVEVI